MQIISRINFITWSAYLIILMSCGHAPKVGDLLDKNDLDENLRIFQEVDLTDKTKFNNFLQDIKAELSSVKEKDNIPLSTWNKIGQLLEIYKSLTQFVPQNKILIPGKTKLVLKVDSFCIDPSLPAPDTKEVFQWGYGDPA